VNIKTLGAIAIVTATLIAPASAQYLRAYGPSYYGPAYGPRTFRGAYAYHQMMPFYGDGWVPESIWDHSRVGGVDPTIRPAGS
jgi:hypothetical protein